MSDSEEALKRAECNLNAAYADYKQPSTTGLALDFREIKLQASIFHYEMCFEMCNLIRNNPRGFALAVALKGLIHKLYEYDKASNSHISKRLKLLATNRGIEVDQRLISIERKKWRVELNKLAEWSKIRNKVTGHYDANLELQVALLEGVTLNEVMIVTEGFLNLNRMQLKTLQNAGRGVEGWKASPQP